MAGESWETLVATCGGSENFESSRFGTSDELLFMFAFFITEAAVGVLWDSIEEPSSCASSIVSL